MKIGITLDNGKNYGLDFNLVDNDRKYTTVYDRFVLYDDRFMFYVKQIVPRVFRINFDSSRELSMTFFRYQEFYESKYDAIREKSFTIVQQMGFYCREYLNDRDATWSWSSDWNGFNVPASVIKQVHDTGILDRNHYDDLMFGIYNLIVAETMGKSAYIIGTYGNDENGILDHEMTHAMFYLDGEYRAKVIASVEMSGLKGELVKAMMQQNYPEKTALDEINAYITTGESGFFDDVKKQVELDKLRSKLREMHREKFPSFVSQKIEE